MPTSLTRLFLCVITTACFLAVPHQGFAQTQTTSSENNSQNQVNDNKKKQLKVQFTRQPSNAHDPLGDYVPCLFSQDVEDAMRTITRNAPPKPEEIPLPIEIFKNIQQTIFHLRDQYDPVKSPAEYNSLGDFYSALLAIFPPDRLVGQYPAEAYSSLLTAVSGARPKVLAVNSFSSYDLLPEI